MGHTPGPRCTKCVWIHEADSTAGTSFQGVGLCTLHASAPALLEIARELSTWESDPDRYGGDLADLACKARSVIARATGEEA